MSPRLVLPILLVAALPVRADAATLRGSLSAEGYTVLAVARSGSVTSAAATPRFRLRAPSGAYTVHLRGPDGSYAGPVVVAGGGGRVVVGLRGGGRLPTVAVSRGFGRVARTPAKRMVARRLTALARRGRPLGAGNLGAVRIAAARAAQAGAAPTGADPDGDAVPSALDIDDDGDLVLDNLQGSAPATGQATVFHALSLDFLDSLNANAGPVTKQQIDAALKDNLFETFMLGIPPAPGILDCGGLSYCSAGGTGTVKVFFDLASHEPFPDCCDEGHPGLGEMTEQPGTRGFVLDPNAASDEIRAGDTYIITRDGKAHTGTLNYVFQTVPAVTAYSDGTTQSTVTYPVPAGAPGTPGKPIEMRAGLDGHVILRVTLWRPQRHGLPGTGEDAFVDMGGLRYALTIHGVPYTPTPGAPPAPTQGGPHECPIETYSALSADLSPAADGPRGYLRDAAPDRAPDVDNTISFTTDVTACLASVGVGFDTGQNLLVTVEAKDAAFDHADQILNLRRVS